MGCKPSKAAAGGGKHGFDPVPNTGMGQVGRAYHEALGGDHGSKKLSVMTGRWEIERSKLDPEHNVTLGETPFGLVYEGRIVGARLDNVRANADQEQDLVVVVKKLAADGDTKKRALFLQEIQHMKEIKHDHILCLIAVATQDEPILMVFESHGKGILKNFLNAHRSTSDISQRRQLEMVVHVARGLLFLTDSHVVHKDLAARNCLVSDDLVVRIGDYGLSQTRFSTEYVQINNVGPSVPIRWMAPEFLTNFKHASAASDLWALAITAWEIACFANLPYPQLTNSEVVGYVKQEKLLAPPRPCPEGLWEIVSKCLVASPKARPSIATVLRDLEGLLAILPGDATATTSTTDEEDDVANYSLPDDSTPLHRAMSATSIRASPRKSLESNPVFYRGLAAIKEAEKPEDALVLTGRRDVKEWPRKRVKLEKELGKGAFGEVRKGILTDDDGKRITCAVKTLRRGSLDEDCDALLAEAYLVTQFDHKNVVACFGQVTKGDPAMIIFEFMANGSLFTFLKDVEKDASLRTKIQMAIDISNGMSYLEEHHFVHRDLATRNILVGEDMVCKVSDFGLSRSLQDDTYYQSEGGMVPVRWTAPEAYKYKKYSSSSDVWSFGITLYEIWTQAALPYGKQWTNMNVMMEVERGYRMPPPSGCPKAIYQQMIDCWNPVRKKRPLFHELQSRLQMAYDLLFPADHETAKPAAMEMDYENLDQIYIGVPVPPIDNLDDDSYMQPASGPPVVSQRSSITSQQSSTLKQETASKLESDGRSQATEYNRVAASKMTSWLKNEKILTEEEYDALPEDERARLAYLHTNKRGSLRKQRHASNGHDSAVDGDGHVDYDSHKLVADVIAISKTREKVSALQEKGIMRAAKDGENIEETLAQGNPVYLENVGRAREAPTATHIVGRKKCVCRRFKCVCELA